VRNKILLIDKKVYYKIQLIFERNKIEGYPVTGLLCWLHFKKKYFKRIPGKY